MIDIHTHTFPDKIAASAITKLKAKSHTVAFTDGTVSALMSSMRESGIDVSVIQPVATNPNQVVNINNSVLNINSGMSCSLIHSAAANQNIFISERFKSSGVISFGAMHPEFEDYAHELRRISELGIKGIKLHPVYQNVPADDNHYIRILECAAELGLWIMIHAGYDIGYPGNDFAIPERILRAMKSSGNDMVILAHMGGWRCWNESLEFFADTRAYIDTSFSLGSFTPIDDGYYSCDEECMMLCADEFVRMIRAFGAERVMFGSDSPWASQKECVRMINALSLSESEKRMIFTENALSIIGLEE